MFSLLSHFRSNPIRKKLEHVFERSKLYVDVGNNKIDVPDYKAIERTENGFIAVYKLPYGIHRAHVEKALPALCGAFNAEIQIELEGQMLYLVFFTNKIPDKLNFNDSFLSHGEIAPIWNVGLSRRGMITVNFAEIASPMMMFASSTGYGKTTSIMGAITQLVWQGHEVYIGDPKLDYGIFKPFVKQHETEPEAIKEMVQLVAVKALEKQKLVTDKGYRSIIQYNQHEPVKLPFTFLLVDEILDFPTDEETFWEPVAHIVRKGRSAGVYFGASLQRVSADMFPKVIRNNIAVRLCLKMEESSDSELVLGNDGAFRIPSLPGRAILRQESQIQLQVPFISDEQVKAILYAKRKDHEDI